MAYQPHVTITANGSIQGGERWSCTLAFGGSPADPWVPTDDDLADFVSSSMGLWETFIEAADTNTSTAVSLTRVDGRVIGTDGKTIRLQQLSPASPVVGASARILPNQCAIVASLRTAEPGVRGRGRIFLPLLATPVDANGRIPEVIRNPIVTRAATMLTGMANAAVAAGSPSTVPLVVASGVGLGANYPVRQVRVGDVVDTQRRRRDKLVEAYASATVQFV